MRQLIIYNIVRYLLHFVSLFYYVSLNIGHSLITQRQIFREITGLHWRFKHCWWSNFYPQRFINLYNYWTLYGIYSWFVLASQNLKTTRKNYILENKLISFVRSVRRQSRKFNKKHQIERRARKFSSCWWCFFIFPHLNRPARV